MLMDADTVAMGAGSCSCKDGNGSLTALEMQGALRRYGVLTSTEIPALVRHLDQVSRVTSSI
jgi:hypothetical protein